MKKDKRIFWIYGAILLTFIVCIIMSNVYKDNSLSFGTDNAITYNEDWKFIDKNNIRIPISLPAKLEVEPGEYYTISNILPSEIKEGFSICIRASMQSLIVTVDGNQIYERGTDTTKYLTKSVGSNWNIVRIPREYAGKEIKLTFCSPYKEFSGIINEIAYGSMSDNLFRLFKQYLIGVLIVAIIFLSGIGLLVFHFYMGSSWIKTNLLLYLAIFSFLVSGWLLGESKMLQFFTGNQFIISNLAYFVLMLLPLPMILYIDTVYKPHHVRVMKYFFIVFLLNFFICIGLQIGKIFDFFETVSVTLGLIAVLLVTVLILLLYESIRFKNQDALDSLRSMMILFIFGIMEIISFFQSKYLGISKYLRIGMLLYIVFLSIDSIKKIRNMIEMQKETQYLEKLAYSDWITQGSNRTAYYRDIEKLSPLDLNNELMLFLFDLNDLKQINDCFGHLVGDDAIKEAHQCINKTFGTIGSCYRIGGDEFACIVKIKDRQTMEHILKEFYQAVEEVNVKKEYDFIIAVGFAQFDKEKDLDFQGLSCRADKMMYENKRRLKKLSSNDFNQNQYSL